LRFRTRVGNGRNRTSGLAGEEPVASRHIERRVIEARPAPVQNRELQNSFTLSGR